MPHSDTTGLSALTGGGGGGGGDGGGGVTTLTGDGGGVSTFTRASAPVVSIRTWGRTTKCSPTPIPVVVLLKSTALCTFCKFLEALNLGLVEWK